MYKNNVKSKLILPNQPFHDCFLDRMEAVFRFARLFGVSGPSSWPWVIWGAVLCISLFVIEIGSIWKVIRALAGIAVDIARQRSVAARFAGTIFYTCALLSLIMCWRLSSSWHKIAQLWAAAEKDLAAGVPVDGSLNSKMRRTIGFMAACAIFEHGMSAISKIGFDCQPTLILRRYILRSHGFLILRTDYSDWTAILILFMSIVATTLWNFLDIVIVLVSIGITSRYGRLNKYVEKVCKDHTNDQNKISDTVKQYTWRNIRHAYVKQALLVKYVDQKLGTLIFLSTSGNFYFICLQIFLGLTKVAASTFIVEVYYFGSLAWLCLRTSFMVLAASDINVHSKRALPFIYSYQSASYNIEIERLQTQLSKDCVALSGMGFFPLHRAVLLQMAGAIVTYELVLLQFDTNESH